MEIPSHFKLIYHENDIANKISEVGRDISRWAKGVYQDTHSDIVAVPVLRGGIFFFADLVRKIECSVEIAPAKAWGYVESVNQQRLESVRLDAAQVPAKGRHLLLVDDICDSGNTLKALKEYFVDRGALEVKTAVLIRRVINNGAILPDWTCFEYQGTEWFVGYGMEDCDRWRNLPSVYIITHS